ncbi:hypothetical protein [Candidatus Phytoplasma sp. AldY-WA1]|uniref:hypothetical protein n=1 Tax=Candidatus Phytoplasma sp. AldY-WA1 TaxID=2852100 RepID=UPI002549E0C6|nr:hypothetical protein [Candidatus Phytoplasma sp. AldY-WA1]
MSNKKYNREEILEELERKYKEQEELERASKFTKAANERLRKKFEEKKNKYNPDEDLEKYYKEREENNDSLIEKTMKKTNTKYEKQEEEKPKKGFFYGLGKAYGNLTSKINRFSSKAGEKIASGFKKSKEQSLKYQKNLKDKKNQKFFKRADDELLTQEEMKKFYKILQRCEETYETNMLINAIIDQAPIHRSYLYKYLNKDNSYKQKNKFNQRSQNSSNGRFKQKHKYTARQYAEMGYTVKQLKDLNYSPVTIYRLGFSIDQLLYAGFSIRHLRSCGLKC